MMSKFFAEYKRLLSIARETGIQSIPVPRDLSGNPYFDPRYRRKFLSSCHRGFGKAQNRVVHLLCKMEEDSELSAEQKEYRGLLLRKVIDGIAFTMLEEKIHVVRRLAFHSEIPGISLPVVREALEIANKLNGESRQTFALVADLTTFIHVTDILRVDFRDNPPSVSLIELKSGHVNKMLLEHLEHYIPQEESLQMIDENPFIEEKYKNQAKRMLRQKIRLAQIDEILTTDQGTDIKFKVPIRLSKEELVTESYGVFLNQLCNNAKLEGYAAGTVNSCIHIGVGFSSDQQIAQGHAIDALTYAINSHLSNPKNGLADVFDEVSNMVPKDEMFRVFNILHSNLHSVPCKPLVAWTIDRNNLISLISKNLCILVAFDVSSFIWLARQVGFETGLSSRKRATQEAQKFGSSTVPRWGNRGIEINTPEGKVFMFSGFFSRLINNLESPLLFLQQVKTVGFRQENTVQK